MRPVLFSVHVFGQLMALHTYGIAIAAGFIVGILFGTRQAERVGEDPEAVRDLCFWLLVASLVGARLLYVATNLPAYAAVCRDGIASQRLGTLFSDCTSIFRIWEGGLVFYGGFFGAVATAWWYARRRGLRFFRTADALAPAVAIGHFFGRLGCFSAGCCWGRQSDLPWAMRFPTDSIVFQQLALHGKIDIAASLTPPLHPVQLYEALGELTLFVLLCLLTPRKRYDGQIIVAYAVAYSVLRFVLELYRGDAARKFLLPGLSTSQAIALVTIPLALGLGWALRRGYFSRSLGAAASV